MKAYRAPVIVGIVLGVGLCWLALAGYSVVIYYNWPIVLLVLLVIAALTVVCQRSATAYVRALLILVMLSVAAAIAGHWGRRLHCRNKCQSCQPILELVEEYRTEHGHYPDKLAEVQGFARTQHDAGLLIGEGEWSEHDMVLDGIDSHDALVYLGRDPVLCVVPVTKRLPLCATRLYVYLWNSDTRSWKYGKLIWFLG